MTGVAADDVLNIRAEPDPHAKKIGEIPPDGICLRNLGCRMAEGQRWCSVETVSGDATRGWVAGSYLVEGGPPATATKAPAEPVTRTERVRFPAGASGVELGGRLNSGDAVNYLLGARAGQVLSVRLLPDDADTHFNVFQPGGAILYESSGDGPDRNAYRGQLRASGDHTVTVYYIGPEAADYRIEFTIE